MVVMRHRRQGRNRGLLEHRFGAKLLPKAPCRVKPERSRRLASDSRRWLEAGLLPLEVPLEGVEEEAVVGDGEPAGVGFSALCGLQRRKNVPVEDFLLLLRTDALVFEEKIQEGRLRKERGGRGGRGIRGLERGQRQEPTMQPSAA